MNTKKLLLVLGVLTLLFFSCELTDEDIFDKINKDDLPTDPAYGDFWAQNLRNDNFYRVEAGGAPLYTGAYCEIWAENGSGVDLETAKKFAKEYDENIYDKMIYYFSFEDNLKDESGEVVATNVMEYASWLVDGNGKLTILLLDIQDDYEPKVNESYCAGYFWPGNFLSKTTAANSNERDMIYIDTKPGLNNLSNAYSTLAHEMQHLMNFASTNLIRDNLMDTWIDEGLSSAAEWVYRGAHLEDRWNWFNDDQSGLIKKGNNFFVWGNREDENMYAVLDDYATVYLFFQWLRLQTNDAIYYYIITSDYYDNLAVLDSIAGYSSWDALLQTWMAANYINAPKGSNQKYGYMDDPTLKQVKANTVPTGLLSLMLAPGEGVYSITKNAPSFTGQGTNIRNAFLNKNTAQVNTSTFYPDGALLTYNVNTKENGAPELGITTGVAASIDTAPSAKALVPLSGPYAVSAGDVLRRNGYKRNPRLDFSKLNKGIVFRE